MSVVLFTESNGFGAVFVREVESAFGDTCTEICGEVQAQIQVDLYGGRYINYSPRPGTADAVGHWSRVEDAKGRG